MSPFWRMIPDQTSARLKEKWHQGGKQVCGCNWRASAASLAYCRPRNPEPVTRELFLDWFKKEFVPAIRQHLKSFNFPQRALFCRIIVQVILPQTTVKFPQCFCPLTRLSMDQNVIQNIKLGQAASYEHSQ